MYKPKKFIRLFKPSVGKEEIYGIKNIFNKAWLGYGSEVKDFENKFSKYIGIKYAVGLNSCTAALHIALAVNKFKPKKKGFGSRYNVQRFCRCRLVLWINTSFCRCRERKFKS